MAAGFCDLSLFCLLVLWPTFGEKMKSKSRLINPKFVKGYSHKLRQNRSCIFTFDAKRFAIGSGNGGVEVVGSDFPQCPEGSPP